MIAALVAAIVGAAAAFGPTANPAEALDEVACVGLILRTFPAEIAEAKIVPRAGTAPSHCHVIAKIGAAAMEMRMPISPWTGELLIAETQNAAALSRGVAIAWSAQIKSDQVREIAGQIAAAYYPHPPSKVLP